MYNNCIITKEEDRQEGKESCVCLGQSMQDKDKNERLEKKEV